MVDDSIIMISYVKVPTPRLAKPGLTYQVIPTRLGSFKMLWVCWTLLVASGLRFTSTSWFWALLLRSGTFRKQRNISRVSLTSSIFWFTLSCWASLRAGASAPTMSDIPRVVWTQRAGWITPVSMATEPQTTRLQGSTHWTQNCGG